VSAACVGLALAAVSAPATMVAMRHADASCRFLSMFAFL
jgi:hypothetical protein